MDLSIRSAACTARTEFMNGRVDAVLHDRARGIYAVASGPPGVKGGPPAAQLFLESIVTYIEPLSDAVEAAGSGGWKRARAVFNGIFAQASDAIRARYGDGRPPDTSATVVVARGESAAVAHVGTTRAYVLTGERVVRLTHDHLTQRSGKRRAQATTLATPPKVGAEQALGQSHVVEVDGVSFQLVAGSHIILVSESIADVTSGQDIAELAGRQPSLEMLASSVANGASNRQRLHDASVVVIQVCDAAAAQPAWSPPTRPGPLAPEARTRDMADLSVLAEIEMFANLSPAELESVRAVAQVRGLGAGEVLYAPGSGSGRMAVATSGALEVARGETVLTVLPPGKLVGEGALYTEPSAGLTVRAAAPTRVLEFTLEALEGLALSHPSAAAKLFVGVARRLGARFKSA